MEYATAWGVSKSPQQLNIGDVQIKCKTLQEQYTRIEIIGIVTKQVEGAGYYKG